MNPMLSSIYELDVEISSLFITISGVAYVIFMPLAPMLRTRKIMRRRVIMFSSLVLMGFACVMRTGNLKGEQHIYWVYIGQILNGIALA